MLKVKNSLKKIFHPYRLLALFCAIMWAAGSIGIKTGLQSAPVAYFMGMRFTVAATLLFMYCTITQCRWPRTWREWAAHAGIGILTNTVYMGLSALALKSVSAGLSSVAAGANGMFLALGATLVFGERLRKKDILGMSIALTSLSLVMYSRVGLDNSVVGIATVFSANLVMVASNLLFKSLRKTIDIAASQCIQLACGGGMLLVLASAIEDWRAIVWDARLFGAIGFLVATCSLGAMVIFLYLLRHATAAVAGSYLFMVPIIGLILGHIFAHEHLAWLDIVGGVGVAAGVYLIQAPAQAARERRRFRLLPMKHAQAMTRWRAALPFSRTSAAFEHVYGRVSNLGAAPQKSARSC